MNQQLLNKILGEFEEKFVEMHPIDRKDMHNRPLLYDSDGEQVDELKDFLTQSLTTAYEEGQREGLQGNLTALNSITKIQNLSREVYDKIFKAGQEDMKKKLLEEMLNELKKEDFDDEGLYGVGLVEGHNSLREEIIKLIEKL